jgi:urea transporter
MVNQRDLPSRWGRLQLATPALSNAQPRWHWGQTAIQSIGQLSRSICAATAEIMFLRGIRTGALLLTAMVLQPGVLLLGLTGVIAAVLFAQLVQLTPTDRDRSPLLFNPLLAGLGVGYLFQPSASAIFLAAAAGVLAFLVTWTLSHILKTFLWLPVLSAPFILVSWVVHLAAFRYAGLEHAVLPAHAYTIGLALPLEGFLRTLGLIFFLPNVWIGMVVALLLLLNSRIQFMLAVASYFLGTTLRGILTGTFIYVYHDPAALNYISSLHREVTSWPRSQRY